MKKHTDKCAINSNVGIPKSQKDSTFCDCDGYHTFDELYEHRITIYIALCKALSNMTQMINPVWKSKLHSDGTCFEGWFVLGIFKEAGSQITYHLPLSKWDECWFAEELEKGPEFDGHTPDDVLKRIATI